MARERTTSTGVPAPRRAAQEWIAIGVLLFGMVALTILAVVIVLSDNSADNDRSLQVFTIFLPVVATWVGTVLAFYFGKENFESANREVRAMVERIVPAEGASTPVLGAMRAIGSTEKQAVADLDGAKALTLATINDHFSDTVTRLPIVDQASKPLLMVHQASVDKYLAADPANALSNTVDNLIASQGDVFGAGVGFVTVAQTATLGEAKKALDAVASAQDIFVTPGGSAEEPALGWLSNTRLSRKLQL